MVFVLFREVLRNKFGLVSHIPGTEIINHYLAALAIRDSGHRGTVDTEVQWSQRNSGHRGTVDTEVQWSQRISGHRGKVTDHEKIF